MSLDTSKIEDYIKRNVKDIIKEIFFMWDASKHIRVRPGIKHKESFGRIATDAILQAGACGWTPQGKTQLYDIELEVKKFKVNENVCKQDLDDTYYNLLGVAGSIAGDEKFVLEKEYVESKMMAIRDAVGRTIFVGDTTSPDPEINRFDGLIKRIKAIVPNGSAVAIVSVADVTDQPYVEVTATAHGFENGQNISITGTTSYNGTFKIHNVGDDTFCIIATFVATETGTATEVIDNRFARTGSVLADVKTAIALMPARGKKLKDRKMLMSCANYETLVAEIIDLGGTGNFHMNLNNAQDSFMYPGTRVEIVGVGGMDEVNDIIYTYKDNLWFGCDLEGDFETFKFMYDEGEDTHKFLFKGKGGTQVVHGQYVVIAE